MRLFNSILCVLMWAMPVASQVVLDGSIGSSPPLMEVESGDDIHGNFAHYLVTEALGETQGTTLFHSFDSFSIIPGEVATFEGSASIDMIVSRTTGSRARPWLPP